MAKKKRKTIDEALRCLSASPEYVRAQKRLDVKQLAKQDQLRAAQRPLLKDLAKVGIRIDSVWELLDRDDYAIALPILIAHVSRKYPSRVREGVARSLAIPEAAALWKKLRTLYETECRIGDKEVAFALGVALAGAATSEMFDEVCELVSDGALGPARAPLVFTIARLKPRVAKRVLEAISGDPALSQSIAAALKGKSSCD